MIDYLLGLKTTILGQNLQKFCFNVNKLIEKDISHKTNQHALAYEQWTSEGNIRTVETEGGNMEKHGLEKDTSNLLPTQVIHSSI